MASTETQGDDSGHGWRPIPDPTTLTTQALEREIGQLESRITVVETNLLSEVRHAGQLTSEKFHTVEQQFELVERQRVEQKSDTKTAVDAALAAQKEAVREQTIASERAIAKSETGTTKQLDQLSTNFDTALGGFRDQIADMKERTGKIEAVKGNNQYWLGIAIVIAGIVAGLVVKFA